MVATRTEQASQSHALPAPTREMADWIAGLTHADITPQALTWAKHAVLDWLGVTIAGAHEPLSAILIADALSEGTAGSAHLMGRPERTIPSQAALINGAASHALDYDDVHLGLNGHPTAPMLPALLALAEQRGSTGREVLTAFIGAYEIECCIAAMIGHSHYDDGWHNTATFGAAAACCKLLGLDGPHTATALGIAATQAAGLKAMFGTMCKPLHAGKAAYNGLLAARLASRGFTSRTDALECSQGFADTQARAFQALPIRPDPQAPYAVAANLFKYHAACYLTHSPIEAVVALRQAHQLTSGEVARITLYVPHGHLNVCNIPAPATGLEVKFSLRHTAVLALVGADTAALDTYSDAIANRPDLVALRDKVEVVTRSFPRQSPAAVDITLRNGATVSITLDVGEPAQDLEAQWARLTHKFHSLVDPILGTDAAQACIDQCATLEAAMDLHTVLARASC